VGVVATYCSLCALPVQHDHYVTPGGEPLEGFVGMASIYRGEASHASAFPFTHEHAWLVDAVAIPKRDGMEILEGRISDGAMDRRGLDGYAPLHRACWDALGAPRRWAPAQPLPEDADLAPFRRQLFDFAAFARAGFADRLAGDPAARRARVEIYFGRVAVPKPAGVMDWLRHAVAERAEVMELVPDEPPRFERGGEALPHAFDVVGEPRWKTAALVALDPAATRELFDTGEIRRSFGIKDLCRVELHVRLADARARFVLCPL
jgi:hypothetical protein